jgi:hypothetical protein
LSGEGEKLAGSESRADFAERVVTQTKDAKTAHATTEDAKTAPNQQRLNFDGCRMSWAELLTKVGAEFG